MTIESFANEKYKCCGCTACRHICPTDCIDMRADTEGFQYPIVDKSRCIQCSKCIKVCPTINAPSLFSQVAQSRELDKSQSGYVVRSKDDRVLMSSTSGGCFTHLAEHILEQGGIVFGAKFNKEFKVVHAIAETTDEIAAFRGSKYVQSDLNQSYKVIEHILNEGRKVLFSGTPCQVAGLKSYLRGEKGGLYTIEVVCYGTPSPKLWELYLRHMVEIHTSRIKQIKFRSKRYGYHSSSMEVCFENGRTYYGNSKTDYMLKSFFSNICLRPSCHHCAFKSRDRMSDVTLFDCTSFVKIIPGKRDDDRGYTAVLVNSNKGHDLLIASADNIICAAADIQDLIDYGGSMIEKNAEANQRRAQFFEMINELTLEKAVEVLMPIQKRDIIIQRMKALLYMTGFLAIKNRISLNKKCIAVRKKRNDSSKANRDLLTR